MKTGADRSGSATASGWRHIAGAEVAVSLLQAQADNNRKGAGSPPTPLSANPLQGVPLPGAGFLVFVGGR
jgi:hypothetical protein